ncbi:hypothetical protein KEM54_002756 [Ascosphaera aggregata]|nr:hypothetical protein KEM54_002756 [Ascosphaera aggregata]
MSLPNKICHGNSDKQTSPGGYDGDRGALISHVTLGGVQTARNAASRQAELLARSNLMSAFCIDSNKSMQTPSSMTQHGLLPPTRPGVTISTGPNNFSIASSSMWHHKPEPHGDKVFSSIMQSSQQSDAFENQSPSLLAYSA